MWDGIGLGQEGAAMYVGAASMCPEAQDDSCARRRLQGQSQERGQACCGWVGAVQKHSCSFSKEQCPIYFPLGGHWGSGRPVLDDPIIH